MRQPGSVKKNLPQSSDRQLTEKLKALRADKPAEKTKHYLTRRGERRMARRDKILAAFQTLIAEKGGNEIFTSRVHPARYRERRGRT